MSRMVGNYKLTHFARKDRRLAILILFPEFYLCQIKTRNKAIPNLRP